MISVAIVVRAKDGTEKATPTLHINSEGWSNEVVAELFAVLCERAGAIGGVGLLSARIQSVDDARVQLIVLTDEGAALSEPVAMPAEVLATSGFPVGVTFNLPVRPYRFSAIDILEVHLPVLAGTVSRPTDLSPPRHSSTEPRFLFGKQDCLPTAAHVVKNAMAAGEVFLGRLGGHGPGIPAYGIERMEIFEDFDFALVKCTALERFPPVTPEMQTSLRMFDEVSAVRYPFSVDPEHLVAVHRGFAGHVVACRQLYRLPGQPLGCELSFPTPLGCQARR